MYHHKFHWITEKNKQMEVFTSICFFSVIQWNFLNGTKSPNFYTRLESAEGKKTENSNVPSQTKLPSNSKENTKSEELDDISLKDTG